MTAPSLAREFGGPIGKAKSLAAAMRALGHDVILVGAGKASAPRDLGLGRIGGFHGTPVPARYAPLLRLISSADVVHVMGFRDPLGTVAALTAAQRRVPVVLEPVGMLRHRVRSFRLKRAFDDTIGRLVESSADCIVVASSVEATDLAGVLPSERIVTRPNGVDVDALLPLPERGALRKRLGIPDDSDVVLALARIAPVKRLPMLAEAVSKLDRAHLVIAGPSEDVETVRAIHRSARDHGMEARTHVLRDGVWGDDRMRAFADADVVCLPSEYESFGSSAAEAAALGIPVVVTDRCGVKDVLGQEQAVIVPLGGADALSAAIQRAFGLRPDGDVVRAFRMCLQWPALAERQVALYAGLRR